MAVYYRTDLTMRQLAPLFAVSPATVCRVIQRLGPLLALESVRAAQEAVERLWIAVAFYTVLYHAGLRPAVAVGLRRSDCHLPKTGWGTLTPPETRPVFGRQWTVSEE